MSTPTTTRGALLRRAGTLLVAAALVGAPSATAVANPTDPTSPTATPTASASASPSAGTSATTPTPSTSTSTPAPTTTATTDPTPTDTVPGDSDDPALAPGGTARTFGPAAAQGPATSTDATLVAAHYLQQQLAAGGHHFSVSFDGVDYPDHGVTADAVLALDAAGTGQDEAARATAWLAGDVVGYLGFGDPTEVSAGSAAKLLNVALAQGVDPTAFGGYDLLTTLKGLEQPTGRFVDQSKYGDYTNTFGQAFALIGLERAGEPVSANARTYLLAQQCPGGGFQLYMSDAGCTSDASADPDATAMAVQALIAVGGASTQAGRGLDYLASRQLPSGGVGGGGPTSGVNANSTGLAGQAFLAGGRTAQARAAVGYLTGLQYGCDLPVALRGGIAYDAAAFAATREAGAAAVPADQDRRSTSQALLALAGTPLASVTADGADAVAPALACAAPTSTVPPATGSPTTTTPGSTGDASGSAGSTGSGGSGDRDDADDDASAPTGSLARTGSDLLLPVGLGLGLVLVGSVAIAATRRRGAHS